MLLEAIVIIATLLYGIVSCLNRCCLLGLWLIIIILVRVFELILNMNLLIIIQKGTYMYSGWSCKNWCGI